MLDLPSTSQEPPHHQPAIVQLPDVLESVDRVLDQREHMREEVIRQLQQAEALASQGQELQSPLDVCPHPVQRRGLLQSAGDDG